MCSLVVEIRNHMHFRWDSPNVKMEQGHMIFERMKFQVPALRHGWKRKEYASSAIGSKSKNNYFQSRIASMETPSYSYLPVFKLSSVWMGILQEIYRPNFRRILHGARLSDLEMCGPILHFEERIAILIHQD